MVSLLGVTGTPHRVVLERYLGDDGEGRPKHAAAVELDGRVEVISRRVQLDTGRVVALAALVFLPGTVEVAPQDRLTYTAPGLAGSGTPHKVELVDSPVWLDGRPMHHECGVT
ncbi:hypothetical protein [Kibdelosporangium phytohabitans]|uniref:Uncharacterized protein n=1 Tax=Kibdelosporangium phytohabitans TaxID=860235 RepID=A0A0N9HWX6_9PSEU|nr:hypothetical protein [Kibdelosporangium phytohabitans]ALG07668.1 hypothetical protein AOZ06_12795 [Kibdelosporangium phytohabitans]ALG07724.1 hypothetical protein AOZ06_13115 [Kibdelosporangium phytohabitans]MBE1471372.1 hypothetical protein [Kibdelosporangium phytohabitans]